MQAITTKYFGAGNVRGSRVKATCQAGSITLGWDHAVNADANHTAAAQALATKLGWHGRWIGGGLPAGNGCVFVCDDVEYAVGVFAIERELVS
jgi:hypothetical protein